MQEHAATARVELHGANVRPSSGPRPPLAGLPATAITHATSSMTPRDRILHTPDGSPASRVATDTDDTQGHNMKTAPNKPSQELLQQMLTAVNDSSRMVKMQRDNLHQQPGGACRRNDALEARMAEYTVQVSGFIEQAQQDEQAMMQATSSNNLEMSRKLSRYENAAEGLRKQQVTSERRITEQSRHEAQGCAETAHAELQRANVCAWQSRLPRWQPMMHCTQRKLNCKQQILKPPC